MKRFFITNAEMVCKKCEISFHIIILEQIFYFHINLFIYSFDCLSFFEKLASVFAKRRTFLLTECEINKIVLNLKTF